MRKILIVDDQPELRELVEATLRGTDFEVLKASSGPEAFEIVKELLPAVIILDVMMPGEYDGLELCRRVKGDERLKQIKVILLSARAQEADRQAGELAGADMYLTKPFSPLELLNAVSE